MMKRLIPCLLLALTLPLAAQFSMNAENRKDKPIKIKSDAMDIDMKTGKGSFYGNVVVDDPEVIIECDRMVLYRDQEKKDDKKKDDAKKEVKKEEQKDDDLMADQKLERIECIGNVRITRKNFHKNGRNHRGTCGKATYFHKLGKIVMEKDPVLYQGENKISGITLSFFQESERVTGTEIKIEARNLQNETKDSGKK